MTVVNQPHSNVQHALKWHLPQPTSVVKNVLNDIGQFIKHFIRNKKNRMIRNINSNSLDP
jgi:hypothetical protein